MRLWLRGSPQNLWRMRQPGVEIGSDALSGHIPRTFDLVALPRPVLLRVLRAVPAIQSAPLERIDVAERAGVGKVELDDIVAVVEWCARVWPQGRFRVEGHERTRRRRGTDARSGRVGGGDGGRARDGRRYDWNGFRRCRDTRRDGHRHSWQNRRRGVLGWQGGRRGRKHLLRRRKST